MIHISILPCMDKVNRLKIYKQREWHIWESTESWTWYGELSMAIYIIKCQEFGEEDALSSSKWSPNCSSCSYPPRSKSKFLQLTCCLNWTTAQRRWECAKGQKANVIHDLLQRVKSPWEQTLEACAKGGCFDQTDQGMLCWNKGLRWLLTCENDGNGCLLYTRIYLQYNEFFIIFLIEKTEYKKKVYK